MSSSSWSESEYQLSVFAVRGWQGKVWKWCVWTCPAMAWTLPVGRAEILGEEAAGSHVLLEVPVIEV